MIPAPYYSNFFSKKMLFIFFLFFTLKTIAQPTITSFSPVAAKVGTVVTITGTNFNTIPANNTVYFGAVKAPVLSATTTTLTVKVPAFATYKPITVATSGRVTTSSLYFDVKFDGAAPTFLSNSFGPPINIPPPAYNGVGSIYVGDVEFADMDDDGKPELIAANQAPSKYCIYKNNSQLGNISFSSLFEVPTTVNYGHLTTGDINGDGKPDIVGLDNGGLAFHLSSTGGVAFSGSGGLITDVSLADLNADGRMDLLVVADGAVFAMKNGWQTTSQSALQLTGMFNNAYKLAKPIDIDNDGLPDVVYTNGIWGTTFVLRNTSTPGGAISFSFSPIQLTDAMESTNRIAENLRIGDIDGDGKQDVVISWRYLSGGFPMPSIHLNTSVGSAISFTPATIMAGNAVSAGCLSISDLDGDGKPDILVGYTQLAGAKNLSTPGNLNFSPFVSWSPLYPGWALSIIGSDLDGDGKPEFIASGGGGPSNNNFIRVLPNLIGNVSADCLGANTILGSYIVGNTYQWQINTGVGWTNLVDNADYSGTTSELLHISNTQASWSGYQYQCIVDGNTGPLITLQFSNTWTGAVSSAWEDPANWSCLTVPDANTNVVINTGPVVLSTSTTIRTLSIAAGVSFTVVAGANLTITN
ncbi:MAG: FG-GAP-like repeat-containing protein [Ferruginibacter sp.]